jgi:outer membrane receptor protein involved in Fe transport
MQDDYLTVYNPDGIWRFKGLQKFLTNQPNSLEGGGLLGRTHPHDLRQTLFGGYIQDDWRLRHNLTLNLGLRFEMTTVANEAHGRIANLRTISDPLPYCGNTDPALTLIATTTDPIGTPGCSGSAPYYSNPTKLNFEPRFGFSWDPRGDGKTAVRGGAAIFDVLPLPGYFCSAFRPPIQKVHTSRY